MDRMSYHSVDIASNTILYPRMFFQSPQGQPVFEDARANSLPLDVIAYNRTVQFNAEVCYLFICGVPSVF